MTTTCTADDIRTHIANLKEAMTAPYNAADVNTCTALLEEAMTTIHGTTENDTRITILKEAATPAYAATLTTNERGDYTGLTINYPNGREGTCHEAFRRTVSAGHWNSLMEEIMDLGWRVYQAAPTLTVVDSRFMTARLRRQAEDLGWRIERIHKDPLALTLAAPADARHEFPEDEFF